MHIDRNLEWHCDFVPLQFNHGRVGLHLVEVVGEGVVQFCGDGLNVYADCIFCLVVGERSPIRRDFRKDDRPFIGIRDHVEPVRSLIEWLPFDRHRIGERDSCVFIRADAPDLAVRNNAIPNLAASHERAMIIDRDISNSDSLSDFCALAW
jgi:hypothetical protein